MSQDNTSTTTLNTLIATLLDSVEGYQKSADDISNQQLAQRFRDRARERQQAVAPLQAVVAQLGGTPEDSTSTLGGAHRMFMNLKEAIVGTDEQTILNEVDRGEDYLKEKFEKALQMDDLAPQARSAIEQAWQSVKSGHDEMSALKHQNEGYQQGVSDATTGATAGQQVGQQGSSSQAGSSQQGGTFSGSDTVGSGQLSASNETFAGTTTGGADQRTLTGTDTYQQQAGGYPGTIGSESGTGQP